MKQFICVFAAAVLTGLFSTAASAHHWHSYDYGYGYGWGGPYYYGGPTVVYGGPVIGDPDIGDRRCTIVRAGAATVIYTPTYWYGGGYWGPRW